MIQVTIGNETKSTVKVFPKTTTLKDALKEAGAYQPDGMYHLNGETVCKGDLNKTFADYGYDGSSGKESCFLLRSMKAECA